MNPNIFTSKKHPEFYCEVCNFDCCKKGDFNRHIMTLKHKRLINPNNITSTTDNNEYTCTCGKTYKHMSSLCAHKKSCSPNNNVDSSLLMQLVKQNDDFKNLLIEQNKVIIEQNNKVFETQNQMIEVCKNGITNNSINNVNSNNKTFNLQVFLNEDCKDAMNVSDFMNSLNLQVSDLECVGQLGFVEGISNIIIKRLNAMDITKRPVHCTDSKRETIYIKEDGVWTKDDDDNMKIRKLVRGVSFRNCRNAGAYKAMYPEWKDPESKHSYIYDKIVLEAFGGTNNGKDEENENKIIRKILKHLTIDKAAFIQ